MTIAVAISREFTFCAAHRLIGHPKCGRLHGHNYRVIVGLERAGGDPLLDGMVLDFSEMDKIIAPLIDSMDHRYLISAECEEVDDVYSKASLEEGHGVKIPVARSTAECMAIWLGTEIHNLVMPELMCMTVEVWETAKNSACWVRVLA